MNLYVEIFINPDNQGRDVFWNSHVFIYTLYTIIFMISFSFLTQVPTNRPVSFYFISHTI